MKIYHTAQRALSETEEKTIAHFRYYNDNKKCFALIGSYVVVILSDEYSNSLEQLEQEALERMSGMLNTPPDFRTFVMDDQYGLVSMHYGIQAVSAEQLSDEDIASDQVNIGTALVMRSFCLEACETGKIIAIIDEEL